MDNLSIKELWKIIVDIIEEVTIQYSEGRLGDVTLKNISFGVDKLNFTSLNIILKINNKVKLMGTEPLAYIISKELGIPHSRVKLEYAQ